MVIGAGIAGLTAARALVEFGYDVVVVEARDRLGGRIHTLRDFGSGPVEAGAELVHGRRAATWPEIRAAGLRTAAVPHARAWFNLAGKTHWLPLHLAHPGAWAAWSVLADLRADRNSDGTADAFLARRSYRPRAYELAALTLTAHIPAAPGKISIAAACADGLLRLERSRNYRVLDGYDRLIAHVALGLTVVRRFTVREVSWSRDRVRVCSTGGDTVDAAAAVTTLPHGVLRGGLVRFEPDLPAQKRTAIRSLSTGPVMKVLLSFDRPFWPSTMSELVCGRGPATLYWPAPRAGADGAVLTAYATGERAQRLAAAGSPSAVELLLEDLGRQFPRAQLASHYRGACWVDWSADPLARGGYTFARTPGARAGLAAPTTGALFWAGAATECHPVADTVETGYLSGRRAAVEVHRHLSQLWSER